MVDLRTEKAIKAWLALPVNKKRIGYDPSRRWIHLYESGVNEGLGFAIIAKFAIASIVTKRYPKRKKAKK